MTAVAIMTMAMVTAVVDPEHAVHASDNAANTCSEGTADRATHRACRAVAAIGAFPRAAFHSSDDTLRMRGDRQSQNGERRGNEREAAMRRREHEQGFGLHLRESP